MNFSLRHRCQRGGKYKSKSKGKRNIGASIKVNCKCYVSTLENPLTKEVVIAKAKLQHTEPCNPSSVQAMVGRVKSGRNFKSIPIQVHHVISTPPPSCVYPTFWCIHICCMQCQVIQRAAALIECRVSTQTLRMSLDRDPEFPRTISTDRLFMRNLRMYIKSKQIRAPKAASTTDICSNTDEIDYEEIM